MWNPTCYGNPGKVSDTVLLLRRRPTGAACTPTPACRTTPIALLVDGGTYNGQTVAGIGLTKAAHIYYRAMTRLPDARRPISPTTPMRIEQSCIDLIGAEPARPGHGAALRPDHHGRRTAPRWRRRLLAVELRTPPTSVQLPAAPRPRPRRPSARCGHRRPGQPVHRQLRQEPAGTVDHQPRRR